MQIIRIGVIGRESSCFDEFAPRLFELGYDVVGSIDILSKALELLQKHQPQVLLISIDVLENPKKKGFIELAKEQYHLPILFTSAAVVSPGRTS